jgi:hypothetical protein
VVCGLTFFCPNNKALFSYESFFKCLLYFYVEEYIGH